MSILQEIQKWAPNLPSWQQDAIARLFDKGELSADDYDDLYALLKTEYGIADPKCRVARKLEAERVAAAHNPETLIQLFAVKNLRHVNALAENQSLPFGIKGITVIYGDNGSGKSGYSRVLKKACRARDQSEIIFPDAKLPPKSAGKAEAVFDLLIDGNAAEVKWVDGALAPDPLSTIAIFDAHCARAYIDEQDDFSYVPYGLDILENLAKACNRLKTMLDAEQANTIGNTAVFTALANTSTSVGKLLTVLSAKTKPEDLITLASLSKEQIDKHAVLEKSLREGNPEEKAKQLTLLSGRIAKLAERCAAQVAKVSHVEVEKLRSLIDAYKGAKAAADLAARQFKETSGQLPGTGGELWQTLFEAARKYAAESHPDKEFPLLGPEAACPLCQQPLGDAARRMVRFDKFIQQEAEKTARERRALATDAYNVLDKANLDINLDMELKMELAALDTALANACERLKKDIPSRREAIKAACSGKRDWGDLGVELSDPTPELNNLAKKLVDEAAALEKASDEKARAILETEFSELDARKQLGLVKAEVLEAIANLVLQAKLKNCQSSVRTNAISIKSTELTEKIVSKELADTLNTEFKRLGVSELHVSLRSSSSKGKTLHKLVLELPGSQRPASILSEGEQRAIAIASFLAEVNIGGGRGGVVFDDPVSSLDHRRRELVAMRLADESKKRQVIVFTHDVYFLCILQQEAERAGVHITALSLHKKPEGFGVADQELPFEGATTAKRVGMLRQRLVECEKLHKAGNDQEYRKHARDVYFHLRLTWERAVEEVLLGNVVIRFREGVETSRLKGVKVENEDYAAVDAGMTKCSKYAHDKASIGNIAVPGPDEIATDINALETWRKRIESRSQDVRKQRSV